jgi:uncharacterized protein involved in exopolysaccharide biosynthesis
MKRWLRVASRFYPAAWRERYAAEFDATLDEVETCWKDVFDVLKGALAMQFTSWNLPSISLTFAVIGGVIAIAAGFSIPNEYQSMSVMRISAQNPVHGGWEGEAAEHINEMEQEVLSPTSLTGMITGLNLYEDQRKQKPIEDIVRTMRTHDISIKMLRPAGGRQDDRTAFTISYVYPDPRLAQAVTQELVTKFTEVNVTVQRGSDIRTARNIEVLDQPSAPLRPKYPNRSLIVAIGLFAGLLAGLTVSYALRWRIVIVRRAAH